MGKGEEKSTSSLAPLSKSQTAQSKTRGRGASAGPLALERREETEARGDGERFCKVARQDFCRACAVRRRGRLPESCAAVAASPWRRP